MGGFKIGNSVVIDASRNLTNIGTISSGAITSSGNIVNDIGNSGDDSFIELKNTGYTGNITSLRQNADSTRAELNSSERSIFVQAGLSSSNSAEFRVYTNAVQAMKLDASQNATFAGTISSGAITASTSGAVASFNRTDNDAIIELKRSGSIKGYIGANTSGDIKFYNNTAAGTLTISSAGNLGTTGTISSGAITSSGHVQAPTLSVNHTGALSGTQVYIKKADESNNLQRWGEGTSGQDTYRFRIDQSFKFIGNSGTGDNIILNSANGNIRGTSFNVGNTAVIDSSRNLTNIGTISSGAITSTGILTLDTSPAANGTGDLVVIPSLSSSAGVGFAGQVFGVNVKNAVHSTHNTPQVSSTWGGVTGATAIAIQADDNTYGQFQVWTAPQNSSADDLLTPKFYIAGSGNATFTGTLSSGAITTNNNFNMTGGYSVYLGSTSRFSSDNNGSFGINYGTTGGTATGSLVIYNNTTATSQLNRNGTIASNISGNNTVGGNIVLGPTSGSSKWYAITGRQYDSGTETEGYSLITGATSSGVNDVTIGGGLDEQNAATKVMIKAAANSTTRNGTEVVRVTTDGLDVRSNNIRITGTTVIDSSRNLTNIGTISLVRAITSTSGNLLWNYRLQDYFFRIQIIQTHQAYLQKSAYYMHYNSNQHAGGPCLYSISGDGIGFSEYIGGNGGTSFT